MFQDPVLIGIPTLNGPDRLERCLRSIAECTPWKRYPNARVLVCDDGSTPENLKANKDEIHHSYRRFSDAGCVHRPEMLMNNARLGIATSWNNLVRHTGAKVDVLINDDIEVVDDWLDVLVYSVTENPIAGMVALNTYVSLTKQQHMVQLGVENPDRTTTNLPMHVARPVPDYKESPLYSGNGQLLASLGSIFAFRRELFDLAGGFDQRYFCYYEEVDFGVTLRKLGYRHFIAQYPVVYHMGGATNSDKRNLDANAELLKSRAKFQEKWGATPDGVRKMLEDLERLRQALPTDTLEDLFSGKVSRLREWNTQIQFLRA